MSLLGRDQGELNPLHLFLRGFDIPPVGGVVSPLPAYQQPALSLKAQSVALPRLAGDQHSVQVMFLQRSGDFFNVIHAYASSELQKPW